MSEKFCDVRFCNEKAIESINKTIKGEKFVCCSEECLDEIRPCGVCGYPSEDRVCSEECAHQSYYGTAHPDAFQEDTPSLPEPPWAYR